MYNQLLGWWFAHQNQHTKQKHPSLNAQGHRNWIRQRFVNATGHARGRCGSFLKYHLKIIIDEKSTYIRTQINTCLVS